MVATPALAKEGSFLWEADFPNMAHSGSEVSGASGSLSKKERVPKEKESLLLKLGVCPCFSCSSPEQTGSQAREFS